MFTDNIKPIERHYNQLVRCLLRVRNSTNIDLCLLESGNPFVSYVLIKRKIKYLSSKLNNTCNGDDLPFEDVFSLCQTHTMIIKSLDFGVPDDPFVCLAHKICEKAQHGTYFNTYVSELNISLNLHPVYVT